MCHFGLLRNTIYFSIFGAVVFFGSMDAVQWRVCIFSWQHSSFAAARFTLSTKTLISKKQFGTQGKKPVGGASAVEPWQLQTPIVTYKPDSPIRSFRLTQRVISDSLISSGRLIRPDSPVTRESLVIFCVFSGTHMLHGVGIFTCTWLGDF